VTLSEEVGNAVRPFFKGDDVSCEGLYETIISGETKGKGSGWAPFKKGKKLTSMSQVKKGMLILSHSKRFKTKNVIRVLSVDQKQGAFTGRFVDPAKPKTKRLAGDLPFNRSEIDLTTPSAGVYYAAVK
jgi:hypothetical protein